MADGMVLDNIQIQIRTSAASAAPQIDKLAGALTSLKDASTGIKGLSSLANNLKKIGEALSGTSISAEKLAGISQALGALSGVQKASGLSSTVNALKKLSDVSKQLDAATVGNFAQKMEQVAAAVRPLATEMQKVSAGFAAFPIRIQKLISSNAGLAASNKALGNSYTALGQLLSSARVKLVAMFAALPMVGRAISGLISTSTDYVENLNLFSASMGSFTEEAKEYAETVGEIMGIDPSQWMRSQGVFMTLATGFQVASDRAALMSKNLTQLGYDISSFYNKSVTEAMDAIRSGFSGEIEPVRNLGYDLSEARLQAIALSYGIDKTYSSMTQAEKSQLRYIALMTQVTQVQGDMARTLQAPANQLRIFSASVTQAARAIGNIFIPVLNAILPAAIAVLRVIRDVANAIASLFGFSLPEVDYSGLTEMGSGIAQVEDSVGGLSSGLDDVKDGFSGAASAAKELKNATIGIDELNVISQDTGSGGGGGRGGIGGSGSGGIGGLGDALAGIELPEYDFLNGLEKQVDGLYEKIKPIFESLLELALEVGAAILAWKVGKSVVTGVKGLVDMFQLGKQKLDGWTKALRAVAGVVILGLGLEWGSDAWFDIGRGTADVMSYIKAALNPLAAGLGGALIGSAIPGVGTGLGLAIGLALAIVFDIVAYFKGKKQALIDNFYASEAGQALQELVNSTGETRELGISMTADLESIGQVDSGTLANFALAKSLIEDIFSLDSVENKTASEIALIQEKITQLNDLNLSGLQGMFEVTKDGYVIPLREEVDKLMDDMMRQFQIEALGEGYKEVFARKFELDQDIAADTSALRESTAAYEAELQKLQGLEAEVAQTDARIQEIIANVPRTSAAGIDVGDELDVLYQQYDKLSGELDQTKANVEEFSQGIATSSENLRNAVADSGELKEKLSELESEMGRIAESTGEVTSAVTQDGANAIVGYAQGITDNTPVATSAMTNAMNAILEAERLVTQTHSPSRLYYDEAMNAMLGYAQGITENAFLGVDAMTSFCTDVANVFTTQGPLIENAFVGILRAMAQKMDLFANSMLQAIRDMMTNMSSMMNSLQVDASGTVTVGTPGRVSVRGFASGGYPTRGDLFFASENGLPEYVGSFGGKSAVANTQNLEQGIAQGVYMAMMSAMQAQGSGQETLDINLYLDGEVVYQNQQTVARNRGYNIGMGAFSNV